MLFSKTKMYNYFFFFTDSFVQQVLYVSFIE